MKVTYFIMPIRAGIMQWYQASFIFGVHICSLIKQILDNRNTVVARCEVKGGGKAPLEVFAVHILRGAKLLDYWKITSFSRFKQLNIKSISHAACKKRDIKHGALIIKRVMPKHENKDIRKYEKL